MRLLRLRPGPRTLPGVLKELASLDAQLQRAMPLPKAFLEPAKRRSIAGTVIPVMNRMLALYQEMLQIEPGRKSEVEPARLRVLSLLCLFGDAEAPARLKDAEAAGSPSAQLAQLMVEWWKAFGDQDAQLKLAGQIKPIAAAHPDDPGVLYQIVTMIRQGASSVAAREPLEQIVLHDLRGEGARQVGEQIAAQMKLRGMEGKPLTIAGQTLDGDKPFSTDEWKGRVIVVYFWATWCEPCKRELPELQDLYNRQHGRGLEIVGVSNDSPGDLKSFLAANKEIIWPQLPKKGPPGFHDLALKFQIDACGIPARFVIDRKGILRSVDPYENLEQRVTSLLDEKP
jgi:thiol-disulfide isomerase/thioredoxin